MWSEGWPWPLTPVGPFTYLVTLGGCVPGPIPALVSLFGEQGLMGKGCSVVPDAPCSVGPVAPDVNDLLKFIRPLHEGTLVFVASYDDPATK